MHATARRHSRTIRADARIRVRGVLVEPDLIDVDEIAVDNVLPLMRC